MMAIKHVLYTCLFVSFSTLALEGTHQQFVEKAIAKFQATERSKWAFTYHNNEVEEGDKTEVYAQYAPQNPRGERWQLLKLNGIKPTPKEAKNFASNREHQGYSIKLTELINPKALSLDKETDQTITFTYPVELADLGKDAIGKLTGTVTINKSTASIEEVNIINTEAFSPVALADISHFKLSMQFQTINNSVLPKNTHMEMNGTFSFFVDIEETSQTTFSNYQFLGTKKI
ncbi:hypothetical protein [Pseudoalteromonas luteoviolacea]|uniref:Lipid/polyisoprenoid-binding YceI-like domain-containing protein n=1 Tax=Pseudoalteromonas luteoviolacea S4060-1 TaxID=1365257 RepID=A0A167NA60_9GAMM|nr:hypothetical protein [Pseudoalteromonas luteoviolacea]KZN67813.1 hypothetical protein N478_16455 [Pseudoalteromonas luteoviolacea S4060-1]